MELHKCTGGRGTGMVGCRVHRSPEAACLGESSRTAQYSKYHELDRAREEGMGKKKESKAERILRQASTRSACDRTESELYRARRPVSVCARTDAGFPASAGVRTPCRSGPASEGGDESV